jgi:hypothetical protein
MKVKLPERSAAIFVRGEFVFPFLKSSFVREVKGADRSGF